MQIAAVTISHYRSIAKADINSCGELNVLIGRNNSGKSNLLLAIKSFFDFLRSATLVATADPTISAPTDWYDRDETMPVKVTLQLDLTAEENFKRKGCCSGRRSANEECARADKRCERPGV